MRSKTLSDIRNDTMKNEQNCPKCNSANTYLDMVWVCPECFHEWDPSELAKTVEEESPLTMVLDANGNALNDGDSVTLIKDLKEKDLHRELKLEQR